MLRGLRRFALLLALFVLGVIAHQAALPPLEFPEEHLHLNYVEWLRAENRLPDRATFLANSTQRESGQPPLAYWLASLPLRLLNLPVLDGADVTAYLAGVRNPWYTPANLWNRRDNQAFYLHGPDARGLSRPDVITTVRVLRVTMIGWGVLSVIGAYGAAREMFRRESWALAAAALFAFVPTMLHIHAYFNNDAPSVAFATLALWQSLVVLRKGASPARLLLIGVLLALGALCKVSVLLVAPAVGVALLLDAYNRRLSPARLFRSGLIAALPLALIFGPWAWYGLSTYGDPLGFQTHFVPGFYFDQPLAPTELLPLLPWVYLTYWSLLGTLILLSPITYTLLGGVLLLAGAGYGAQLILRPPLHVAAQGGKASIRSRGEIPRTAQQALVLGAAALIVLAGLVRWVQTILFIPGRLLYPAHLALAIGAAGGLAVLACRFPRLGRAVQVGSVGLVMCAGLILAPLAIHEAHAPPRMLAAGDLPALSGEPLDFDGTIRFLGYAQPETALRAGGLHRIAVCWEVLRPTDRLAAYAIKLVRDGDVLADRTTIHGLGRYDSSRWRAGDRWCEDVDIPIPPELPPGHVYDVLLGLLDARTQAFDWQAARLDGTLVASAFIGQAVSPAGDLSGAVEGELTPAEVSFPGFADLAGYGVEGTLAPGESVRLDLLWDVTGRTPDAWSQFVHLVGPADTTVLADGVPRGGDYPAWAWSPGERVADSWSFTLPADLPPGEYTVALGFYRQDGGERMPALVAGQPAENDVAPLLHFQVE